MKNVFRCNDDTWKFQAMIKGKKYRKSFKSKTEAEAYARTFFDARKMDLTFFSNLSGEQLKDIKEALAILPEGKTLHEVVERAWRFCSTMDMQSLSKEFLLLKKRQLESNKLSYDEFIKKHFQI